MASGDRLQIVLEAKDEISQKIGGVRKNIKALEAQQKQYAELAEQGNEAAARSHEETRRAILQEKSALEVLKRERTALTRESTKAAEADRRAAAAAQASAAKQKAALQGVFREVNGVTNALVRQRSGWSLLSARVTAAAASFKAKWTVAIASVQKKMATLQASIAGSGAASLLRGGAVTAGLAGGVLVASGLRTATQLEQSKIAFEQLLGSQKKAAEMNAWLAETAARTPFDLPGLTQATQQLLAFGFNAEEAQNNLMVIGNAAAATGKGAEGVDAITRALGQMQAKQKISGEEMLQMTEAGIPAWDLLAKKMGKTVPELQAMTQTAGGGAALFKQGGLDSLISAMGTKYDGLMKKQSKTLGGRLSTLWDTLNTGMAKTLKKGGVIKWLKQAITAITEWLPQAFEKAKNAIGAVTPVIKTVVTFIRDNKEAFIAAAAAIGVMTLAMGALAIAANATGIPLIIMAIGALVGLIVLAYKRVDWFRTAVDAAFKWIRTAVAWFVDWFKTYAVPVIKVYLKAWWFYLSKVVWPVVKFVFKMIWGAIKLVANYVSKVFWPVVRRYFGMFVDTTQALWQKARGAWDKVVGAFRGAKDRIGTIVQNVKDFFSGLWSGLTEGLPAAIQTMKDWLGKIPGFSLLPGFWAGGPVAAGTTAVVGEIGPELFVPNVGSPKLIGAHGPEVRDFGTSGVIIPNHLLGSVNVPQSNVTVNVPEQQGGNTFHITAADPREAVREFERAQARERRLQRERV